MRANLHLPMNEVGTDYVVADIHGEYDRLMWKLGKIGFNREVDRLLCTGDLCDRGPNSYECAMLLWEPWMYSTRGNHEQMCIDAYRYSYMSYDFYANGGDWFTKLTDAQQDEVVELFSGLPLTIYSTVKTDKGLSNFLLVHARVPEDYGWARELDSDTLYKDVREDYIQDAIWNRHMQSSLFTDTVEGYDVVLCGHTVVSSPKRLKNYLNLDVGVVFYPEKEFAIYNTKTKEIL
jgi:serine/threonine protein phosphatase 1